MANVTRLVVAGIVGATAISCGQLDEPEPVSWTDFEFNTTVERPSEELPFAIAKEHPRFAGYYCEDGDLVVGVTLGVDDEIKAALSPRIERENLSTLCYNRDVAFHVPKTIFVEKQFSFLELRSWRDRIADPFFDVAGARSLGIDYVQNHLIMGVEPYAETAVHDLARARGVASDAIAIVDNGLNVQTGPCPNPAPNGPNIWDCFRPIPGGVKIRSTTYGGSQGTGVGTDCTLTAATDRYIATYGYWQSGLVTASHCVKPMRSNLADYVYQPSDWPADYAGVEYVDPTGWNCGQYRCRYSDSAWAWSYAPVQHGTIVQTIGPWVGSYPVSTSHPRFYVWGSTSLVQNMQIEKVGNATGWTTGAVTNTCIDELAGDDGIYTKLICQARTSAPANPGDSGSPVFYWWWFYNVDTVELVGLLWGQSWNNSYRVFSPWANVEREIGPLYIQYPYF